MSKVAVLLTVIQRAAWMAFGAATALLIAESVYPHEPRRNEPAHCVDSVESVGMYGKCAEGARGTLVKRGETRWLECRCPMPEDDEPEPPDASVEALTE